MRNYRKPGYLRRHTNSGSTAISSGTLVVLRSGASGEVGVATDTIAAGAVGDVAVAGVFDLPKGTGVITAHALVYRNSSNQIVATSTGNTLAGINAGPTTATAAGTIPVLLNSRPGTPQRAD